MTTVKSDKSITYKSTGVNYHLMDDFKNACIKAGGNKSQITEQSNSYLIDITEGLGSLNQLADDIYESTGQDFYYQVGWGNAATILNDLAAFGAKPQTIKLFVAAGNESWFADKKRWKNLIRGFKEASDFAGVAWNGGETQTLVGVINKKSIVLAGASLGIVSPKSQLISDEKLQVGDKIILIESSGVHTNGITLIRKIFKDDPKTLIQAIKPKTLIYSRLITKLLDQKIEISFASHITGHGLRKIMRSKKNLSYVIDKLPKPQPIFRKIQAKTGMSDESIYGDYNMGVGYVLFTRPKFAQEIVTIAKNLGYQAIEAGIVEAGPRKIVLGSPVNVTFEGSLLQIR